MLAASGGILGTLPGWLTFLGILAAAFIFYRGGGGTAIHSLQTANQVLEKRVRDLEEQAKRDAQTIAVLSAKTDLTIALEPLVTWTKDHELHDREQFERILKVLDLIALRLDPDGTAV